jgi:C_GCAxxG_C_C family probable redox protein
VSEPAETAVFVFSQNFNCCQAVFSAFATRLDLDNETALKLASPFGGGIARRGLICGAVTGALMALGLGRGADKPAGKEKIYRLSQEFMRRFEEKHNTLLCRNLIGIDISVPEGWEKAKKAGKFTITCPSLVWDAAEIAHDLLESAR